MLKVVPVANIRYKHLPFHLPSPRLRRRNNSRFRQLEESDGRVELERYRPNHEFGEVPERYVWRDIALRGEGKANGDGTVGQNHWAKDFVFVFGDGYIEGVEAFLSSYHGIARDGEGLAPDCQESAS